MKILKHLIILLSLCFVANCHAQSPAGLLGSTDKDTETEKIVVELGRSSPRSSFDHFLSAISHDDYALASRYFESSYQSSGSKESAKQAALFEKLLDQRSELKLETLISNDPQGDLNDNDEQKDQIGKFRLDDKTVPIYLINKGSADQSLWVIAKETTKALPKTLAESSSFSIDNYLPSFLSNTKLFGVPLGHWLGMLVILAFSYLIAALICALCLKLARITLRLFKVNYPAGTVGAFTLPLKILITSFIFVYLSENAAISVVARQNFSRVVAAASWIAILILVWRLINVTGDYADHRIASQNNPALRSIFLFVRRFIKFALIVVAGISLLSAFGVDVTAGLAALGIGGIALALGAQKTVENFVGSITVVLDQPVRVGDFCKIGDTLGSVETIGIRSTRIRTADQTLMTIPNGDFSAQKIENFALRQKFKFNQKFGITYDTSSEQILRITAQIRDFLLSHELVSEDPCRVRLSEYAASAKNIELFTFILTSNYDEYAKTVEEILIKVDQVIKAEGSDFAYPSQTVFLKQDQEQNSSDEDEKN